MNKLRTWGVMLGLLFVLTGVSIGAIEAVGQLKEEQAKGDFLAAVTNRIRLGGKSNAKSTQEVMPAELSKPLVTERVSLPDVEGHFWLTFLYQDDWQKDAESVRLHQMFASDPRLVEMQRRCRLNSFGQMDPYLVERWQKYVGQQTPMLVLQAPDGKLCFKASRGNIPATADELVERLQQSIDECFHRPCPGPCPQPAPAPQPEPLAPVSPLSDTIGPAEEPRDAGDPLWLLAVLGISGVAIGAVIGRKRR